MKALRKYISRKIGYRNLKINHVIMKAGNKGKNAVNSKWLKKAKEHVIENFDTNNKRYIKFAKTCKEQILCDRRGKINGKTIKELIQLYGNESSQNPKTPTPVSGVQQVLDNLYIYAAKDKMFDIYNPETGQLNQEKLDAFVFQDRGLTKYLHQQIANQLRQKYNNDNENPKNTAIQTLIGLLENTDRSNFNEQKDALKTAYHKQKALEIFNSVTNVFDEKALENYQFDENLLETRQEVATQLGSVGSDTSLRQALIDLLNANSQDAFAIAKETLVFQNSIDKFTKEKDKYKNFIESNQTGEFAELYKKKFESDLKASFKSVKEAKEVVQNKLAENVGVADDNKINQLNDKYQNINNQYFDTTKEIIKAHFKTGDATKVSYLDTDLKPDEKKELIDIAENYTSEEDLFKKIEIHHNKYRILQKGTEQEQFDEAKAIILELELSDNKKSLINNFLNNEDLPLHTKQNVLNAFKNGFYTAKDIAELIIQQQAKLEFDAINDAATKETGEENPNQEALLNSSKNLILNVIPNADIENVQKLIDDYATDDETKKKVIQLAGTIDLKKPNTIGKLLVQKLQNALIPKVAEYSWFSEMINSLSDNREEAKKHQPLSEWQNSLYNIACQGVSQFIGGLTRLIPEYTNI